MNTSAIIKEILENYKPIALFTYETASSRDNIIQLEGVRQLVIDLITKHFGENYIDNKITMLFQSQENKPIYVTYWDGKLSIGLSIYFFNNTDLPQYQYKVVQPTV